MRIQARRACAFSGTSVRYSADNFPQPNDARACLGRLSRQAEIMTPERRKDFAERAKHSENQFRALFEMASVGMAVTATGDRQWLIVNDKLCQITGYARAELLQMRATDFIHPDDRQLDDETYRRAAEGTSSQHLNEKRYVRKDGAVVWVRVNSAFTRDASGRAVRTMSVIEDISERVRGETALRESERRLKAFLDGMPDRARLKDVEGRFIVANLSEAKALGASSVGEIIGKTLYDFRPQDIARAVADEERALMTSGDVLRVERQSRTRGTWTEIIKAPIRDEQSSITGLVAIERDITQRKRFEDELRETEYRLREFLDGIPGRAWFKDTHGRYIFMNTKEATAQGIPHEKLIGKSVLDFMPGSQAQDVMAEDERVVALGKTLRLERVSNVTGSWSEIVKAPVRRIDGTVIGIVGIMRDISDSKKSEEALRDSEGKLRALLDALPDRAWLKDAQGRYVAANRSAAEFVGSTPENIVGKTADDLFPPELAAGIKAEERRVMEGTLPLRLECQFSGNQRWYETIKTPIRTADGSAAGLVAIARDVTERRQVEDELRATKAAAEDANRAKGEFLSHMSHEMRTPMNAILGFAELAMLEQPNASQCEHLEKITAATKSLLRVIDDVLDFERVDAGKLQLEEIDFRLGDILQNVRDVVERTATAKGLALRFKTGEGLPVRLRGDPARIGQILMNLCANAVKFTARGYVEVAVRLEGASDERVTLHFEVRDTGIGMSADEQLRLFQPFAQADSSTTRRFGGTGLGLIICKRLAELMGGRIWMESEPGEGTTVFLTLSCAVGLEPARDSSGQREKLPEEANVLVGARVLVVDDHPINRMLMAKLLKLSGAESVPAENGRDALRVLELEPSIDLVLMDLRMPEMDGYEATRRIRADARWAKLPIVAVTASAATYERARCMAVGMNDVLVKPIQQATFFPVIAAAMRHHEKE